MLRQFTHPRRVVITGMGCVTPIGIGREAFWSALQRGDSGVRRIESFDVSESPVKIAAAVRDFDWQAQRGPEARIRRPVFTSFPPPRMGRSRVSFRWPLDCAAFHT